VRFGLDDLSSAAARGTLTKLHKLVYLDGDEQAGIIVRAPEGRHHGADFEWQVTAAKADVLWHIGEKSAAIDTMISVIDAIEQTRNKISFEHDRRQYFRELWIHHDRLISYLLSEERIKEALETVERAKTKQLSEILRETDHLPASVPDGLRRRYHAVRRHIAQCAEEAGRLAKEAWSADQNPLGSVEGELARLFVENSALSSDIRRRVPGFDPDTPLRSISFEEMRALVRAPDHGFIVFWDGSDANGVFILTGADLRFVDLENRDKGTSQLQQLQDVLDRLPRGRGELVTTLRDLYVGLFESLRKHIDVLGFHEITFVHVRR